jgi:sugar-specific transcriptional regulator TrmB
MKKQSIKVQLKKLGFSQHEVDVYLTLLETGITSAGEIIKQTGLHRNVVYSTMDKLIKQKLVVESNKRGVKYFRATNVERISKEKEHQLLLAKNIIPELKNIQKRESVDIITYEGIDGFQTAHKEAVEQMSKNKIIYVLMAGGTKFYEFMGEELKKFDKIRKQNNNKIKILASHGRQKELEDQHTQKRSGVEVRYLPIDFLNPIGSSVYGDKTLLFVYTDTPIVITIDSKSVAKAHVD